MITTSRMDGWETRKVREIPSGYDKSLLHHRAAGDRSTRRHDGAGQRGLSQGPSGWGGTASPLRLWRLRLRCAAGLLDHAAEPCGPRASPTPSRIFAAATIWVATGISRGKLMDRENTFTDFVDVALGLIAKRLYRAGQDQHLRRQCGRGADGCSRQHRSGIVGRGRRACAVRRCDEHHAGREPAVDARRMARMGQSDYRQGGFRIYARLQPLR